MLGHPVGHCSAQAAVDGAVLHCHYRTPHGGHFAQQSAVERLHKGHVVVGGAYPLFAQLTHSLGHFGGYGAGGDEGDVGAGGEPLTLTYLHKSHGGMPVGFIPFAARIADSHRRGGAVGGGVHQVAQHALVARCGNYHAGDGAQIRHVEGAVVRHSVLTYYPRAVYAEGHGQILYRHIVDHLVESALQEGGIYGHKRLHALFGQTAGKGHGVLLGDSHVEHLCGQLVFHYAHRGARQHRGGDSHYFLILAGELQQRLAEYFLIFHRMRLPVVGSLDYLAGGGIEAAGGMPCRGVLLGGCVPFPFLGLDMQYPRTLHILDVVEHFHKGAHVVPVDRPEIADVQPLEDVLFAREKRFQTVVEPQYGALALIRHQMELAEEAEQAVAQVVVPPRSGNVGQIAVQRPGVGVDAHIVVVEDDKQVVGGVGGIVDPLEGQSAADGGVTDHGHHIAPRLFVIDFGGYGHPERRRDGVGGMPGGEGVVFALGRIGETAQTAQGAVGGESLAAPGEQFVAVGLMAHIPHYPVVRRIKHIVKRHRKLHRAHRRGEVARIAAQRVYQECTYAGAYLRQLSHRQAPQIGRRVDAGKQCPG